jgi:hypothetical protein
MGKPWEKYAAANPATTGQRKPWEKYQQSPQDQATVQLGAPDTGPQMSTISSKGDSGINGTQGGAQPWNSEVQSDMAKSLDEGVFQGVVGLAGVPRTLADAAQSGVEYGAGKLGFSPETVKTAGKFVAAISPGSYLPSAQQMSDAVHGHDGTKEYQSQSTAGKYSRAVGEMLPSALAGPGGVVRKTAMTVIPAVAGQAVGDATGNEYAKAGAQILTGGLTAGFKRATGNAVIKDFSKSKEAIKAAATDAYDNANATVGHVQIGSQDFGKLVRDMNKSGAKEGIGGALAETTDKLYSNSKSVLSDISKAYKSVLKGERPPPTFGELEKWRQTVNKTIEKSTDAVTGKVDADGRLGILLKEHLDGFVQNTPFKEARNAYRTVLKTERIQRAIDTAGTRTSSPDLAFKNEFQKIVRENLKNKLFSDAEMVAIKNAAGQGLKNKILEGLGRLGFSSKSAGTGIVAGGMAGAIAHYAGVNPYLAAGAEAAFTTGAKVLSTRGAKAAAERARVIASMGGDTAAIDSKLLTAQRAIDQRRLVGATARSQEIQRQRNKKLQKAKNVNALALLQPKL